VNSPFATFWLMPLWSRLCGVSQSTLAALVSVSVTPRLCRAPLLSLSSLRGVGQPSDFARSGRTASVRLMPLVLLPSSSRLPLAFASPHVAVGHWIREDEHPLPPVRRANIRRA
jgi:hypothetical protein